MHTGTKGNAQKQYFMTLLEDPWEKNRGLPRESVFVSTCNSMNASSLARRWDAGRRWDAVGGGGMRWDAVGGTGRHWDAVWPLPSPCTCLTSGDTKERTFFRVIEKDTRGEFDGTD